MRFSGLVFPCPNPPTYSRDRLVGELLYVPKDFSDCPYKYMDSRRVDTSIEVDSVRDPMPSARDNGRESGAILQEIGNQTG